MGNRLIIARIRENLANRNKTDRIMWFSMWFLTSVATFGLAFFPMIYLLVDRRNKHFKRQKELEALLIAYFKNGKIVLAEKETNYENFGKIKIVIYKS